jgi:primosomal protein N'
VCVDRPLLSLDRPFTYSLDAELEAGVGSLVQVPFHGKNVRGWVLGPTDDVPARMLKVRKVVSPIRFFDAGMLSLLQWMSERYIAPLASVIARAVPPRVASEEGVSAAGPVGTLGPAGPGRLLKHPRFASLAAELAIGPAPPASRPLGRCSTDLGESRSVAAIDVRPAGEDDSSFSFRVTVRSSDGSETHHDVTLSRTDWLHLGAAFDTPEKFVHSCFEFLLAREEKESIMGHFDVGVIGRYFPEFEGEIAARPG